MDNQKDNIWFNTKENHKIFLQLKKEAGGYCYYCQKPLTSIEKKKSIYCNKHYKQKMIYSLIKPVRTNELFTYTMNYHQHLHLLLFKCNVSISLRGIKENRIKPNKIDYSKYLDKLDLLILQVERLVPFYNHIKQHTRITKRLLYNITLFYISYYIINKPFVSEEQFNASVTRHIFYYIQKTYIRLTKSGYFERVGEKPITLNLKHLSTHYNPSEAKKLLKGYNQIIKPFISELYT